MVAGSSGHAVTAATDNTGARQRDLSPAVLRERLSSFIESRTGRRAKVSELHRFPAGMSWSTFGFEADAESESAAALILRLGDPGGLLAPYTAKPEFLALTSLGGQARLPIPKAFWYSDDESILGAPFIVSQRMPGQAPLPWRSATSSADDDRTVARDFTDALAAIHAFDWRASPVSALAEGVTPANAARRALDWWVEKCGCDDVEAPPQMRYAMRWLQANAPASDRVCVVHGDYRVGNFLQADGRISAILDWELVHLGDRHEDLAWASSRTFSAGTGRVGGLIAPDEFFGRYEAQSGLSVDRQAVAYYEVLAQFKMAALQYGGARRIEDGRASDVRMAAMGFQLTRTLLDLGRSMEAVQ